GGGGGEAGGSGSAHRRAHGLGGDSRKIQFTYRYAAGDPLLRCINLLEQPDRGRVRVGDQTIDYAGAKLPDDKQLAGFRARTGMVFQLFNLFPHMAAVENVSAGPRFVKKMQPNEAKDMAIAFLAQVGLADGDSC